jgi:RNA recognition motif-containing protein
MEGAFRGPSNQGHQESVARSNHLIHHLIHLNSLLGAKNMKIMMRNLSRDTTEAELLILFKEYGDVQYCKLVIDKVTGKSKGFGFVEMPRTGEARAAIKELNYRDVGGNKIRVKKAEKRKESANENDSGAQVSYKSE